MICILNDVCSFTSTFNSRQVASEAPDQSHNLSLSEFNMRLLLLSTSHRCPLSAGLYPPTERCPISGSIIKFSSTETCLAYSVMVFLRLLASDASILFPEQEFLSSMIGSELQKITMNPLWIQHAEIVLWMVIMALTASNLRTKRQAWQILVGQLRINNDLKLDDFGGEPLSYQGSEIDAKEGWSLCNLLSTCVKSLNICSLGDTILLLRKFLWIEMIDIEKCFKVDTSSLLILDI